MVIENVQSKRKQSTLPFKIFVSEKKIACEEASDEESNNEESEVLCSRYNYVGNPTKTRDITWGYCDTCKI